MKIAILTTPLFYNYGGILQCYALLTSLKRLGHNVTVIDIQYEDISFSDIAKGVVKAMVKKYILGDKETILYNSASRKRGREIMARNITPFIEKNIQPKTIPFYGVKSLRSSKEIIEEFDVVIVGSDQVWRPKYSDVFTYFLGFLDKKGVRKIAYAASFGTDKWEYSDKQTLLAKTLSDDFYAISVREKSGIDLCERYFNKNATHVLDPTLLLDKKDYLSLIQERVSLDKKLMVYMLDINNEKQGLINSLSEKLNISFYVSNNINTENGNKTANDRIVPSIESWINGYMNARYVLTDSFHGTVFAIIFNIPFIVYGNKKRGLARFESLLKIVGLEERLIESKEQLTSNLIHKKINWEKVNEIIELERKKSYNFLKCSLEK